MTLTITISPPPDARWMSTDADGEIRFWRRKPKPYRGGTHRFPSGDGYWVSDRRYDDSEIQYRNGNDASIPTHIPRPDWRDTLVRIK